MNTLKMKFKILKLTHGIVYYRVISFSKEKIIRLVDYINVIYNCIHIR